MRRVFSKGIAVLAAAFSLMSGAAAMDVGGLLDEFEANSMSALEKYKDNPVEVRGVVQEVRKDSKNKICVVLSSADGKFMNCQFSNDMKETLMGVKKGDALTVEGVCDVENSTRTQQGVRVKKDHPFLKNCSLKSTEAPQSGLKGDRQAEILKSLVTIEGKRGSGSGFVAAYGGKKHIFTNTHVILGNKHLKFKTIDGGSLPVKSILLSKDRDLLLLEVEDSAPPPLELETSLAAFQNGAPVIVMGNSLGGGVNTFLSGNVLGVGPQIVEITASIVPGNSGSPIIAGDNGKVLGVASLISIYQDWTTVDTRFAAKRKFGVRVDNINDNNLKPYDTKAFEELNKKFWNIQSANLCAYEIYKMFPAINRYFASRSADMKYPSLDPEKFGFSRKMEELVKNWNSYEKKDVIPVAVMKSMIKEFSSSARAFLVEDCDSQYVENSAKEEREVNKKLLQLLEPKLDELEKMDKERKKRPSVVL